MKSAKRIQVLTYSAIAMILLLQGIWMVNAYWFLQEQTHNRLNNSFSTSANKELMLRKNAAIDSTTNEIVGIVSDDFEKGLFSGPELVYQEFLIKKTMELKYAQLIPSSIPKLQNKSSTVNLLSTASIQRQEKYWRPRTRKAKVSCKAPWHRRLFPYGWMEARGCRYYSYLPIALYLDR